MTENKTLQQKVDMAQSKGIKALFAETHVHYESLNSQYNFGVWHSPKVVAEQIDTQQKRLDNGEKLPLAGVSIGVKDNIAVENWPMECCSKLLKDYVSPYDAFVIERLREAGAILYSRMNMDAFAMGSSNEHSAIGVVKNPVDPTRVPGGSSGGSAAAVAAGALDISLGSDTGGSIRQPASLCGIYGFKPSYGAVSRRGLVAFASSLDQIGPFAKNLDDLIAVQKVLTCYDPYDSTSVQLSQKVPPSSQKIKFFKVAEKDLKGCQDSVKQSYFSFVDDVAKEHQIGVLDMGFLQDTIAIYYLVATAEAAANLARFDGIRYGSRCGDQSLEELISESRSAGFGNEVKRRILLGNFVLSSGYFDSYYGRALKIKSIIKKQLSEKMGDNCFLLLPTSPTTAFKLGEKFSDPMQMYLADLFTVFVNLVGFPGLSMPIGKDTSGLPIGCQVIGLEGTDFHLLDTAKKLTKHGELPS